MPAGRPAVLRGWGRTSPSPAWLTTPASAEAVAAAITGPPPRGLLARGLGRSYGDAAQNAGGLVLAPFCLAPPSLDVAGRTVTAGGGESVDRLLRLLLPHGLTLPVLPGTRFLTLAGAVAADVHGKNHSGDGSIGRWVRELVLLDGCGELRRLSATEDPDAFWATVGGMGLTGVILSVTVRLLPVATSRLRVLRRRVGDLDAAVEALAGPNPHRYAVAWLDCLADGPALGRGVVEWADHASPEELPPAERAQPLRYRPRRPPPAPPAPAGLLRPQLLRAANAARFRRTPAEQSTLVGFPSYFHQLDALGSWSRLYGPAGLVQYQFLVPDGAERLLRGAVEALRSRAVPPYLVVLKRHGAGTPAPLSFPAPGWSLAIDVPAGAPGLAPVLDHLDEQVAAAGGRIYLAKDSRLRPDVVPAMYPELPRWRTVRDRLDPDRRFRSDLDRRIGLSG